MERITRRNFLKYTGLIGVASAVAGINEGYTKRLGQERYPLSPVVRGNLREQARKISSYFTFEGFDQANEKDATGYKKITPLPEGFAEMFLSMAYFEGGQSGVNKTIDAISKRGVEVALKEPLLPTAAAEILNPLLLKPDQPYQITVKPEYLLSGLNPIWHEAYHVHQFIRDGELNTSLFSVGTSTGTFVVIYAFTDRLIDVGKKAIKMTRREFLGKTISEVIKAGTTLSVFIYNIPILNPLERQAYYQTNGNNLDTITEDNYIPLQIDLFKFEK